MSSRAHSKRSQFVDAAKAVFAQEGISTLPTRTLWKNISEKYPELVATSEKRKTPRVTCFRDLRKAGDFVVVKGKVTLGDSPEAVA